MTQTITEKHLMVHFAQCANIPLQVDVSGVGYYATLGRAEAVNFLQTVGQCYQIEVFGNEAYIARKE
jgi:hypothetical protein